MEKCAMLIMKSDQKKKKKEGTELLNQERNRTPREKEN